MPMASAAPRGAAPGPAPKQPCPARRGPEEGRHRAPRAGGQPGRGFQSSRHGAGVRPGRSPDLVEKPRRQGFLKELSCPAAREGTEETKPAGAPRRPGLWSLRPGQPAARCRAGAPRQPWGPSASPLHISRASRSQPRWPPSSTGERVRGRGAPGTSKEGPWWRVAGGDPERGRSQAGEPTGLGSGSQRGIGEAREPRQAVVLLALGTPQHTEARKRGPLKCPLLLLSGKRRDRVSGSCVLLPQ